MDSLLIFLGIFGLGAIIVSVHVITVAGREYESDRSSVINDAPLTDGQGCRREGDRRNGEVVIFPLAVKGTLIREDRRILPDRRLATA
jgi:hypothetical protein